MARFSIFTLALRSLRLYQASQNWGLPKYPATAMPMMIAKAVEFTCPL